MFNGIESLDAVIIDPVLDYQPESGKITTLNADLLLEKVKELKCNVKRILETHCHADHLTASAYLKRKLDNVSIEIKNKFKKNDNLFFVETAHLYRGWNQVGSKNIRKQDQYKL